MSLIPIEGQPGLFRSTDTGKIYDIRHFCDYAESHIVEGTGKVFDGPYDFQMFKVTARHVVLDALPPLDLTMKIYVGDKLVSSGTVTPCTILREEGVLAARLTRLERAIGLDAKLRAFGELHTPFTISEQPVEIAFNRAITGRVILSGVMLPKK